VLQKWKMPLKIPQHPFLVQVICSLVIRVTAFTVAAVGFRLGQKLGSPTGNWAGVIGGLLLIGIGTRVLVTHIT